MVHAGFAADTCRSIGTHNLANRCPSSDTCLFYKTNRISPVPSLYYRSYFQPIASHCRPRNISRNEPISAWFAYSGPAFPNRLCQHSYPATYPCESHPLHQRNEPIWARTSCPDTHLFQPLSQKLTGCRHSPNQPILRPRYFLKRTSLFDCSGSTFLVHFGILRASKG